MKDKSEDRVVLTDTIEQYNQRCDALEPLLNEFREWAKSRKHRLVISTGKDGKFDIGLVRSI